MKLKLGRKARIHDPRVPHMDTLRRARVYPPIPPQLSYVNGMPSDLGMMLNDSLGDCTCAAVGHAIQVWTHNTQPVMVTPPDSDIELLYEQVGGYVPGNPNTDNGAVEQTVLSYWLNNAVDGASLAAFVEIDVGNYPDVQRSVWECGVVYIGFVVPAYVMSFTAPGSVWDLHPELDQTIIGGHAVDVVGYDSQGNLQIISWGALYTMTHRFWTAFVDEAYALASTEWITATGDSPAGMNLADLEQLMQSMQTVPTGNGGRHMHRRKKRRRARST